EQRVEAVFPRRVPDLVQGAALLGAVMLGQHRRHPSNRLAPSSRAGMRAATTSRIRPCSYPSKALLVMPISRAAPTGTPLRIRSSASNRPRRSRALVEISALSHFFCSSKKSWANWLRYFFFRDRKSTRLNSSHVSISYAVFCLKKKRTRHMETPSNG